MGAWEWYDRQFKLIQAKHDAKKKKPLARKTAASHVLRDLRELKTPDPKKSIKGVGIQGNKDSKELNIQC